MNERFLKAIDEIGYTGYRLAKEMPEISNSMLTHIRNGRNEPSKKVLKAFTEKFPQISYPWLLTGKGEMLKESTLSEIKEPTTEYKKAKSKGTPYYDIDFTASFLEIGNNQQAEPNSYINHPFFLGCDYVVRASGQSMARVISHGDAIGLVKLNNWFEFLPFGEVYAIVTRDDYRMIKIITKGESDDGYTLISKPTEDKKDEFPPQQIKKDSVLSIFKVQASSHLF